MTGNERYYLCLPQNASESCCKLYEQVPKMFRLEFCMAILESPEEALRILFKNPTVDDETFLGATLVEAQTPILYDAAIREFYVGKPAVWETVLGAYLNNLSSAAPAKLQQLPRNRDVLEKVDQAFVAKSLKRMVAAIEQAPPTWYQLIFLTYAATLKELLHVGDGGNLQYRTQAPPQRNAKLPNPLSIKALPNSSYYITTALSYTNGPPHIGHAYEMIITDTYARFLRMFGDTVFCTGTDEHGGKIAAAAAAAGMTPQAFCDFYFLEFRKLNSRLDAAPDLFIRTTSRRHLMVVDYVWRRLVKAGWIYKGKYCGWYCTREEVYISEAEAKKINYLDTVTGKKLERVEEDSHFFKLSKLEDYITSVLEGKWDIIPEFMTTELLGRLAAEGTLEDLSVSRKTIKWGIPVPDDPEFTIYVWFDALLAYVTACWTQPKFGHAADWPPTIQFCGKDIAWFHAVIFPCMLYALDMPLSKALYCHGMILDKDGRKMSKSTGNVITPYEVLDDWHIPPDSLRYFMCRESSPVAHDIRFDYALVQNANNTDLADCFGNLLSRSMGLCFKYLDGILGVRFASLPFFVPLPGDELKDFSEGTHTPVPFLPAGVALAYRTSMLQGSFRHAVMSAIEVARQTNSYLARLEPWKMPPEEAVKREITIRNSLEAVYFIAALLLPVLPERCLRVFAALNTPPPIHWKDIGTTFSNIPANHRISEDIPILFPKLSLPEATT